MKPFNTHEYYFLLDYAEKGILEELKIRDRVGNDQNMLQLIKNEKEKLVYKEPWKCRHCSFEEVRSYVIDLDQIELLQKIDVGGDTKNPMGIMKHVLGTCKNK